MLKLVQRQLQQKKKVVILKMFSLKLMLSLILSAAQLVVINIFTQSMTHTNGQRTIMYQTSVWIETPLGILKILMLLKVSLDTTGIT